MINWEFWAKAINKQSTQRNLVGKDWLKNLVWC